MNREEFSKLAFVIKSSYSTSNILEDEESVSVWYELLKDMDYETCKKAVLRHICTSKFPPTIADIRGASSENAHANDYVAEEAWNKVYNAIGNSIYNSEEEFNKLPPLIQRAVGSAGNLRELAVADAESVLCEKGRFIRQYNALQKIEKEMDSMPQSVRALIEQTSNKMLEG